VKAGTEVAMTKPLVGPFATVTPLYHFSSQTNELFLDTGVYISKYVSDARFDAVMSRQLEVYEPDFLLWTDPVLLGQIESIADLVERGKQGDKSVIGQLTDWVSSLLVVFRLFKPGYLRAGETFVVARAAEDEPWRTLGSSRASLMVVDYGILGMQSTSYTLEIEEIPFFCAFTHGIFSVMDSLDQYPALSQALSLYSADNGDYLNAVGSMTALEALLTKKEETEGLTYRLALRIANLLGTEASSRKATFRQVKEFYNLRSKIVHGVTLDKKLLGRLSELDALREMVRRVLLSSMALYSEGTKPVDLPDVLDELALDEECRKRVGATASKFLHLDPQTVTPSPN
jgi:Apea-like HEPN